MANLGDLNAAQTLHQALPIIKANNTENVDMRTLEPGYVVDRTISVAGDVVRDMQDKMANKTNKRQRIAKTIEKMFMGVATKIVCFGDSITWGYKVNVGSQVANPYPAQLQTNLRKIYNNNNITVVNKGVGGNSAAMGYARIQSDVLNQAPDLVIVMFGINDANPVNSISRDSYKSSMIQIVEKLLKNNIEVLILSSTPIIRSTNLSSVSTDLDRYHILQTYTRVVEEIAIKYQLAFIDMYKEIENLFMTKAENAFTTLPDWVHFEDSRYKRIANIITGKMLDYHAPHNVIRVDGTRNFYVRMANSPFVDTDSTISNQSSNTEFTYQCELKDDGTSGTYIRASFYVDSPDVSLVLVHSKSNAGGQITVVDNDADVMTIDSYSSTNGIFDAETVIYENLSVGLHMLEFLTSKLVLGQSTYAYGKFYGIAFRFKPNPYKKPDKPYTFNQTTPDPMKFEKFTRITRGTMRLKNANLDAMGLDATGVILYESECVQLQTGKTLVIEADGTFKAGSGISWFGNPATLNGGATPSGVAPGYVFYCISTALRIYNTAIDSLGTQIASYTTTPDYNVTHKIRIEHTDAGVITVFWDGIQVLQVTNTKEHAGYFGVYQHVAGTMELTRFEYAFI